MSEPFETCYFQTEEVIIKAEPEEYFEDCDDDDSQEVPEEEEEATWRPIKIESIIQNHNYESEEEGEIRVRPTKVKKVKSKPKKPLKKEVPKPKKPKKPQPEILSDEFMCSKCSKRCANLAGLSSHYMRCGKSSGSLSSIVKSDDGMYCTDCGKTFKDIRGAKIHRLYCNKATSSKVKQENALPSLFECDICGATFKIKSRIKQHMVVDHSADAAYQCEVCGKKNVAKSLHELHIRTHLDTRDRPFACLQCTKCFKSKAELQRHVYGVHVPAEEKPSFECDECSFVTSKQEFLIKHQVNQHVPDCQKPFQCEICSKGFITDKEFDRHTKTHTNRKMHPCLSCERQFKTKAEMKEHYVKDHTDYKPFICEVCNKGCNHRHSYRRHLRKHEKELGIKLDKSVRKFNIRIEDYLPPKE
ncbi:oocyte zinc finger protein XlCOF6-like [Culicoides brevitarsis]|uniref:oocyte zinc finger protein XlCOF6-like n=1 Tax=Culicoides brevitarsis TaxID=469753 RepID=UPI00307C27FB